MKALSPVVRGQDAGQRRGKQRQTVDNKYVAGVAQWQSEGLIIPRPWVRFPPPAPIILKGLALVLPSPRSRRVTLSSPAHCNERMLCSAERQNRELHKGKDGWRRATTGSTRMAPVAVMVQSVASRKRREYNVPENDWVKESGYLACGRRLRDDHVSRISLLCYVRCRRLPKPVSAFVRPQRLRPDANGPFRFSPEPWGAKIQLLHASAPRREYRQG